MRKNHALAQIRAGEQSMGLWLHNGSPYVTRAIAAQGLFDWMLVDLEHSPTDRAAAAQMFGTIADISGGNCTPLARVTQGTLENIKQALDSGAQGVIVPMVSTAQDAADAVRFSRYPPQGERGAGGMPQLSFGTTSLVEYIQEANREILVGVQIETQEAIENIEAIAAIPGIDLLFVGPTDLHLSLGLAPAMWSSQPAFTEAMQRVVNACHVNNVGCGTIAYDVESARARLAEGFSFLSFGIDITQLTAALHEKMKQVRD